MAFRRSKSIEKVPLPIVGHTVASIHIQPLVTLIFAAPGGLQLELRLEFEVILGNVDGSSEVITASNPGSTFDANSAYERISPLIGMVVSLASAYSDGRLEIAFYEGATLKVHPDNYEAWHFQQPAPGSRKPYHYAELFSLTGYGGGLT